MHEFKAKRVTRVFSERIEAPRSKVFPLLCPVREYDWLSGWSCDMIYSDSSVVEDNCIFKTGFLGHGEEIWVTTRYDEQDFIKEFVVVNPSSRVLKLDVRLNDLGDDCTEARWTFTITALNESGNSMVDGFTEGVHRNFMGLVAKSLKLYCETGTMLKVHPHGS
ncbi:hypothetical protein ACFL2Q_06395 [Thermodesulfobacteriota bacterium]